MEAKYDFSRYWRSFFEDETTDALVIVFTGKIRVRAM